MFYLFLSVFLGVALMLMSVALVTLFERKVLALSQLRLGPNKVLLKGLLQPLLDGVKLLHKSLLLPFQAFSSTFSLGPTLILMSMILIWSSLPGVPLQSSLWASSFLFLMILSFGVYGVLITGLSSVSKYGFFGGVRSCIQSVSYEISLALIIFSVILLMSHVSWDFWSSLLFFFVLPVWGLSVVAEINRAPFDLAEGESELISGLNLELGSVFLAFVFVGEYGMLICFAWFTGFFFWSSLYTVAVWVFFLLFFRSVFPRFRYDKLLSFCWTVLLPLTVSWMLFSVIVSAL